MWKRSQKQKQYNGCSNLCIVNQELILIFFRVAGNSAYIIGTLAESELGCYRIMALAKGHHGENRHVLSDLTRMLTFDDAESVMNAAGTMGTLVSLCVCVLVAICVCTYF